MTIGPITLAVSDLTKVIAFYTEGLGLQPLELSDMGCSLGLDGVPFIHLETTRDAISHPRAPGLFHIAFLLPSRPALALQLRHLAECGIRLQGASDHLVSEALYLADPEGNGIELYCDRPRNKWPYRNGELQMATEPLNLDDLLSTSTPGAQWTKMPTGTILGHIHLQVHDVALATAFYRDLIGLDLTTTYGASAAFLSYDGYHHHLAVNCWNSRGAALVSGLGLKQFELRVKKLSDIKARLQSHGVRFTSDPAGLVTSDPSGNQLRLTPTAASDD